jgi:hypothetical protein
MHRENACMTIPTREQLYEEVDRRFAAAHPSAPQRLDPDDPNQSEWVQQWMHIRAQTSNEWTDWVFKEHFPYAGTLDPSNPDHSDLIAYWKDIHHQISTGEAGQWSWDSAPQQAPSQLVVTLVQADPTRRGFILTFSRALVDLTEAERYLFGQEHPPVGVTIEQIDATSVHLEPTIDSLRMMPEDVSRRISEEAILTAE